MRTIQHRIRAHVLKTQEQQPDTLPRWLRALVRLTSGGDEWTASFVRGILWKYRWLISLAAMANLGTGLAEAATLGILAIALNYLASMVTETPFSSTGSLGTMITTINQAIGGQQPLVIMVVLVVFFQLSRSGLDYAAKAAVVYLRVSIESDVQRRVFNQLIAIRYQQIVANRLGSLTSYSTQVQEIGMMLLSLNQVLNDLVIIVASVAVLFWLSWQFTLVSVAAIIGLFITLSSLRTSIRQSSQRFLGTSIRLNEQMLEYLQGLRLVHIFGRERTIVHEVEGLIDNSVNARGIALLRQAAIVPLSQCITIIALAILLGVGYWFVKNGAVGQIGSLVTYLFVLYRVAPRITSFNNLIGLASSAWPTVVRVAQLLNPAGKELEYTPGIEITELRQGIEFRSVSLRYPVGESDALRNISFYVPAGKMVGMVGASGSGKSSIINLLLGLNQPTGGQIFIDEVDLQVSDLASWRRLIGVVDQDTMIFSKSVAENIRFGKIDAGDEEVIAAARIANADLFIKELSQQYQTEVGDRGFRLSGGQRQRIAIARAVIHDPALLLLDEATSALDSQSERLIQESLEELRKERTVIVIAHRLSTVVKADLILVLDNGQIVEQGSHQELLALGERYAAMWQLQAASM